jgi:omega-amidase
LRSLRRRSRPSGGNETLKVLLVCFFTCGILLHLPMYAAAYAGEHLSWLKALLGAVHHTLRMFVLDGELDPIHEFAMSRPAVWSDLYFGAAIVVYLVSPLLTFSVVLSFFKNLSALWRYAFRRCTELYVFSELNEDSLYLAGSIKAAHPKGLVVFTDVYENESEEFGEQMAAAHRLGAACFKTDIALLRLRRSDRSRPVYFFLLGRDKAENLRRACVLIRRAAEQGAQLVMLPEMFCCPYENEMFRPNSEEQGGPAQQALSALSRELGIWIVGGTIPEREGKKLYNTCYVYDDQGRQAARHRKIHLFDVNVEGGQYFMESDTFAPGNDITLLDTPWGRVGLCVCFDLRFEELCRVMALRGARMILAPAAFNMTTGPAHWELLLRQRAVDNQLFTVGTAPARDESGSYVAWGHSMVCEPWGGIVHQCGTGEEVAVTELELSRIDAIRRQLPILSARRTDLYEVR